MSDFVPVGMQDILHSSKPGVREGKIKPLRLRKRVWRMLQSLFSFSGNGYTFIFWHGQFWEELTWYTNSE
jgi:hypothetical protein